MGGGEARVDGELACTASLSFAFVDAAWRPDDLASPGPPGPRRARLAALGYYAPEHTLTNADLEKIVDTTDEWIVSRTGHPRAPRRGARPGDERPGHPGGDQHP